MRIKNPKAKGSNFERIVKRMLLGPDTEVFRSPASLGSADLISISKDELVSDSNSRVFVCCQVKLIQCKYIKKYMSKKETDRIVQDAERLGATAWLAYREKPRGKIRIDQLFARS